MLLPRLQPLISKSSKSFTFQKTTRHFHASTANMTIKTYVPQHHLHHLQLQLLTSTSTASSTLPGRDQSSTPLESKPQRSLVSNNCLNLPIPFLNFISMMHSIINDHTTSYIQLQVEVCEPTSSTGPTVDVVIRFALQRDPS